MRIVRLRLICHHSFLSTIRSSRKSLRILYHSVLNKGKCKFQHETGEEVQLSMSFFADAYLRHFLPLTLSLTVQSIVKFFRMFFTSSLAIVRSVSSPSTLTALSLTSSAS